MSLISKSYQLQLEELHSLGNFSKGEGRFPNVQPFIDRFKPSSLIDYGCGHGGLIEKISRAYPEIKVRGYDPGNKNFNKLPKVTSEALICLDVIEHFEPDTLKSNLKTIGRLATKYLYLNVACYPAAKVLPDGRNCHLIIESPDWWREKFEKFFGTRIEYNERNAVSYRPGKEAHRPELTAIIEL